MKLWTCENTILYLEGRKRWTFRLIHCMNPNRVIRLNGEDKNLQRWLWNDLLLQCVAFLDNCWRNLLFHRTVTVSHILFAEGFLMRRSIVLVNCFYLDHFFFFFFLILILQLPNTLFVAFSKHTGCFPFVLRPTTNMCRFQEVSLWFFRAQKKKEGRKKKRLNCCGGGICSLLRELHTCS